MASDDAVEDAAVFGATAVRIAKLEGQLAEVERERDELKKERDNAARDHTEFYMWAGGQVFGVMHEGADECLRPHLLTSFLIDTCHSRPRQEFRHTSTPGFHILAALREAFEESKRRTREGGED